ncbi:MAG: hypothetical protein ICV83_35165 [Cytophagales bacterium]|nr:hypothetical protein [Cytophagales bacterium]
MLRVRKAGFPASPFTGGFDHTGEKVGSSGRKSIRGGIYAHPEHLNDGIEWSKTNNQQRNSIKIGAMFSEAETHVQGVEPAGMNEDQLLQWCNQVEETWAVGTRYWTAEVYGFGRHIREYAYYPAHLPLLINTDHGISMADEPGKTDLESKAPVQFCFSARRANAWRKLSNKPCYVMYSPFVFYRRSNRVAQAKHAAGTLAFPAHTTPDIDDETDYEQYSQQLKALPEALQPVSVCLHYHDINKGLHKIFMKHGFPVYSAGHPQDYRFTQRFYEILRQFRYSTSNLVMSCLFYSVEMGIPHFLYGSKPLFVNKGDTNLATGKYDPENQFPRMRQVVKMFEGIHAHITGEQRKLVTEELGLREGMSRLRMAVLLRYLYYKHSDDRQARLVRRCAAGPLGIVAFVKRKIATLATKA